MNFKFWTVVGGKKIVLHTENLFEARRLARAIGGMQCLGLNPMTQRLFVVESRTDDFGRRSDRLKFDLGSTR